ncbi:MAG: hypothetical protein JWO31_3247 [Phycisphaerales bacterium]|nr:hypothetical protein [Phycisphaerales bacterium]
MTASRTGRKLTFAMRRSRPPLRPVRRAGLTGRCLLAAALALAPTGLWAAGKQPKKTDGPYGLTIRGSCTGQGSASVKKGTITLSGQVRGHDGRTGSVAADLTLDGDHFDGTGTVLDRPANFFGRLDGYDGDKHFRGARILCSYTDSEGRSGRIAGSLQ